MSQYLAQPYLPQEVDRVTRAFPASVQHLMPMMDDIPVEFQDGNTQWDRLFRRWFYEGLPATTQFAPVDGINAERAFFHLKTVIGSFEPKHEHKEAAVAYLASLWFHGVRLDVDTLYGEDWDAVVPGGSGGDGEEHDS